MIGRRPLLSRLLLFPVAAMVPRVVFAAPAPFAFAPGTDPFRLIRRVERELRDGALLAVERTWSIRFVPLGQGYRLEGNQANVSVDAPADLGFLGEMERARVEDDMFPLLLSPAGEIMGRFDAPTDRILTDAIEAVRRKLAGQLGQGDHKATAERFLAQLQLAGEQALAGWPAMLFAPGTIDHTERRDVPLPDGRTGEVVIRTLATSYPETGVMQWFERRVETRLGGSGRVGLERFTLTPQT